MAGIAETMMSTCEVAGTLCEQRAPSPAPSDLSQSIAYLRNEPFVHGALLRCMRGGKDSRFGRHGKGLLPENRQQSRMPCTRARLIAGTKDSARSAEPRQGHCRRPHSCTLDHPCLPSVRRLQVAPNTACSLPPLPSTPVFPRVTLAHALSLLAKQKKEKEGTDFAAAVASPDWPLFHRECRPCSGC